MNGTFGFMNGLSEATRDVIFATSGTVATMNGFRDTTRGLGEATRGVIFATSGLVWTVNGSGDTTHGVNNAESGIVRTVRGRDHVATELVPTDQTAQCSLEWIALPNTIK